MKLTIYHGTAKPSVAVGRNQCPCLSFVEKYRGWHTFTQDRATSKAVRGLERRGCVVVQGDQYKFAE